MLQYGDEMVDDVIRRAATMNIITQQEANMLVGKKDGAGNVVQPAAHVVERSDIARLLLIYIEGGVYMDVDTLVSKRMTDIFPPQSRTTNGLIVTKREGLDCRDRFFTDIKDYRSAKPGNYYTKSTI